MCPHLLVQRGHLPCRHKHRPRALSHLPHQRTLYLILIQRWQMVGCGGFLSHHQQVLQQLLTGCVLCGLMSVVQSLLGFVRVIR